MHLEGELAAHACHEKPAAADVRVQDGPRHSRQLKGKGVPPMTPGGKEGGMARDALGANQDNKYNYSYCNM